MKSRSNSQAYEPAPPSVSSPEEGARGSYPASQHSQHFSAGGGSEKESSLPYGGGFGAPMGFQSPADSMAPSSYGNASANSERSGGFAAGALVFEFEKKMSQKLGGGRSF